MKTEPIILGIESSCDDTGAAIIKGTRVLSNIIANQKVHVHYGGVVPELASRAHQQNIIPTVFQALKLANISKAQIDGIAFTRGPGLVGSLLVGISFAKSLAMGLGKPLMGINHMQAHILAHFIDQKNHTPPPFPFLCLTVSGGHTQLVLVRDYFSHEIIGETLDDAVGEAFDKTGKILGLGYPAGPQIDKLAALGNPNRFVFNRPKTMPYQYSFSGLKTAFLYFIQKESRLNANFIEENLNDLCASIQYTLIEYLISRLKNAAKDLNIKHVAIAGGVSANGGLRKALKAWEKQGYNIYIPDLQYTTDNAAMVAMAGYLKYKKGIFDDLKVAALPRY